VNPQLHEEFVVLCALYYSGEISEEEWALLQIHMAYCDSCLEKFQQYQRVTSEVIPALAASAASETDTAPQESAASLEAADRAILIHDCPKMRTFSGHEYSAQPFALSKEQR
jgi:hypothetical protein